MILPSIKFDKNTAISLSFDHRLAWCDWNMWILLEESSFHWHITCLVNALNTFGQIFWKYHLKIYSILVFGACSVLSTSNTIINWLKQCNREQTEMICLSVNYLNPLSISEEMCSRYFNKCALQRAKNNMSGKKPKQKKLHRQSMRVGWRMNESMKEWMNK